MHSGASGEMGCVPESKYAAKHGMFDWKEEAKRWLLPSDPQNISIAVQIVALLW